MAAAAQVNAVREIQEVFIAEIAFSTVSTQP
jgi:hypothetical protein